MTEHHSIKIPEFGNFEMRYYFYNGNETHDSRVYPPHLHDDIEIYLLIEGDASFFAGNKLYRLQPYDAVISAPNEMHNCILNSKSKHRHFCFWFSAGSDFLFADFLRQTEKSHLLCPNDADREHLSGLCQKLMLAAGGGEPIYEFSLGMELLAVWHRAVTGDKQSEPLPQVLQEILSYIDEKSQELQRAEELCRRYFISRSSLERLFRGYLHTTPKQYLETKKLAHSRILLSSGKSVAQACRDAGFADRSNYIRLFKKRFGITPGMYQKQCGGGGACPAQEINTAKQ